MKFENETDKSWSAFNLTSLSKVIHRENVERGWWDKPREIGTLLMLVVSEISEAMEGERKNLMDDHLPHRTMLEAELADAMIRILDIAGSRNLDIGQVLQEKLDYNRERIDHSREHRSKPGGKTF